MTRCASSSPPRSRRRSATTVAAGRELTKDQLVESMRTLNAAGLAVPRWPVEWGGQDWTSSSPHLARGDGARLRADPARVQRRDDRAGHRAVRHRGAEGGVPPRDRQPRHLLVAGLLRARRRLRPGRRCAPPPSRTATTTSSTARRPGPRSASTATGSSRWCAPTPRPRSRPASRCCSSTWTTPGLEVRPIQLIDGGHEVNEVWFDDVRVPGENLVGELNRGWDYREVPARQRAGRRRAGRAPSSGSSRRGQGAGRGTGSADDPLLAARIAELENELLALELTAMRVVAQLRRGQAAPGLVGAQAQGQRAPAGGQRAGARPGRPGRPGQRRRRRLRPRPSGQRLATPLYLNLRKASIYGGSNEVQRQIIARTILGL